MADFVLGDEPSGITKNSFGTMVYFIDLIKWIKMTT